MNLSSSEEMETWYDKYNYFMVDLRDPRYVLSLYTAHHYTIAFNIFCVYSYILSKRTTTSWCPRSGRQWPSASYMCSSAKLSDHGEFCKAFKKSFWWSVHRLPNWSLFIIFRFMKNRDPYDIKHIIIGYNLFQTLFSLWGFSEGWK